MLTRNLVLKISRQLSSMSIHDFYPDTPSLSILSNNDEYILNRTEIKPNRKLSFFFLGSVSVRFNRNFGYCLIEFGLVSVWSVNRKLTEISVKPNSSNFQLKALVSQSVTDHRDYYVIYFWIV